MKRKPILIICIMTLLLSCFIGCGIKTDVNNFAAYADTSYHSNPIDDWYQEVKEEYVGTSWSGVIAYIYRNAWKAELEYRVQREGTEQAESYAAYLEAVEQEAEALENWCGSIFGKKIHQQQGQMKLHIMKLHKFIKTVCSN